MKALKIAHLAVLGIVVSTITLLHAVPAPFLDFLRMPLLLRAIDPYIGNLYPSSFYAYHWILYFLFIVLVVDFLSLRVRSRRLELIGTVCSLAGALIMISLVAFFLRLAVSAGDNQLIVRGMIAYISFCGMLCLLDLATFATERNLLKKEIPNAN